MKTHADAFGHAELNIIKSVMAGAIKDYLNGLGVVETKETRPVTGRAKSARNWITQTGKASTHYVFGFEFICKIIGLDPDRFRKRILFIKTRRDADELRDRYFEK